MLTGLTEVAGVGNSGEEFWCAATEAFSEFTVATDGPDASELMPPPADMWCGCVECACDEMAEPEVGVTAEPEDDAFRKELWWDFIDWATAAAAAAAAADEPPLLFGLFALPPAPEELLDLLPPLPPELECDECEFDLLALDELELLLLLLPLFDVLRDVEQELEPELTFFELLRLLDCCCCCSCWRHLARRFLNQTWKRWTQSEMLKKEFVAILLFYYKIYS